MKRAYKLQEFVGHTSNVNCLKIGRKSSGVLVTGGDDKKVNVWAIGKPNAILSLSGHQSPIECVTFDTAEQVVVAGASGGTLKVWDLDEAKVVRTLTGHRSNCLSVECHPFGDFFASGSLDTNLKVWDMRRNGCIHTYRGHTTGITHIRFSPDGRLVASGSQDGSVKLWDLTAGKLLHEFDHHDHAITGLEFHPTEFMLATSSADRTVKLWDVEKAELIDTAGPEATGVRAIAFPPAEKDGSKPREALLSAVQDGLRVWGWEPVKQHDFVEVPWTKVADLSLRDDKLIGCSFNTCFVGVWVVDLTKVAPFSPNAAPAALASKPGTAVRGDRQPVDVAHTPQPLSAPLLQGLLPPPSAAQLPRKTPSAKLTGGVAHVTLCDANPSGRTAATPKANDPKPSAPRTSNPAAAPKSVMVSVGTGMGDSLAAAAWDPKSAWDAPRPPAPAAPEATPAGPSGRGAPETVRRRSRPVTPVQIETCHPSTPSMRSVPSSVQGSPDGLPPRGLDIQNFLPQTPALGQGLRTDESDEQLMTDLCQQHTSMMTILASRLSHLQVVHGFWARQDMRGALAALQRCGDASVAADVLSTLGARADAFRLDHCADAGPLLERLLASEHDSYAQTAVDVALALLRSFGQVIRETCKQPKSVGVDPAFEARRERCLACRAALLGLLPHLQQLKQSGRGPSLTAQKLLADLATL
ncbi:hypothetical protein WJX72_002455 [[Myrmecia] bisecta]|uniref:Katanin p80 WD40 repeat-containing subunit B1 homolog n=1 Tax=[Myrmecia] bisecta TaxID=41462 RepID=A0AAW1QPN5_9CHLO